MAGEPAVHDRLERCGSRLSLSYLRESRLSLNASSVELGLPGVNDGHAGSQLRARCIELGLGVRKLAARIRPLRRERGLALGYLSKCIINLGLRIFELLVRLRLRVRRPLCVHRL